MDEKQNNYHDIELDPIYQDVSTPSEWNGIQQTIEWEEGETMETAAPQETEREIEPTPYRESESTPPKKKRFGFWHFILIIFLLGASYYAGYWLGSSFAEQRIDEKISELKQSINTVTVTKAEESKPITVVTGSSGTVSPVVEIAQQVAPSVVTITSTVEGRSDFFFNLHTYEGYGSGILYKADIDNIYIITNHHVIENSTSNRVSFHDGDTVDATVIGYDSRNDLAVLKVAKKDLKNKEIKLANFGDSNQLKVGQLSVAIGNPLGAGHDHTITAGVISSVNRTLDIENIKGLQVIQTDAAINPGNSGGALVNEKSEVIGINTAKYLDVKVEGIGFAIPSSVAIPVVEKILENGTGDAAFALSDDRPFLGISFSGITSEIYEKTGVSFGVYVTSVYEGGAAANAGIQKGDVLFSINGSRIRDAKMLFDTIGNLNVGEEITLGVVRDDKILDLKAKLTSFGEVSQKNTELKHKNRNKNKNK